MARRDLIVSFLSSVPTTLMPAFSEKPLTLQSPVTQHGGGGYPGGRQGYRKWVSEHDDGSGNVIPKMFRAAGGKPTDSIGRVCVMGFSNGCIGVDEVLRMADSARIDLVIACDGIHGAYQSGQLYLPSYKRFLNHAAGVLQPDPESATAPVMVITHSSIVPPNFPSTTETAQLIWQKAMTRAPPGYVTPMCGYDCPPAERMSQIETVTWPGGKKVCASNREVCFTYDGLSDGLYARRAANGLYVLGWGDTKDGQITTRDPTGNADHIFQGHEVLPQMLSIFAASRWNTGCGLVGAAGFGQMATSCTPGKGRVYDQSSAGKVDYFPDLGQTAPPPKKPAPPEKETGCPAPPEGYVIVGSDSDPCAVAPKERTTPPKTRPPVAEPGLPWWAKAGLFGGAAAAGFGAARWMTRDL